MYIGQFDRVGDGLAKLSTAQCNSVRFRFQLEILIEKALIRLGLLTKPARHCCICIFIELIPGERRCQEFDINMYVIYCHFPGGNRINCG